MVAAAIAKSGVPRSEIFITTKVAVANLGHDRFLPSVEESLKRLGTDRVDLLLVHWPVPDDASTFESYMCDLALAKARGMARLIGVSNFTIAHLTRAEPLIGPGEIVTNQVEAHPYLQNGRLRQFADAHGLSLTAYLPVARGAILDDPVLKAIATRHGATPAQISLAFLLAEGFVVIPSSSSPARIEENFTARQMTLTKDDIARIRGLDRGKRFVNPAHAPAWDA